MKVRQIEIDFSNCDFTKFRNGCVFESAFINTLSLSFPLGERIFIDAIIEHKKNVISSQFREELDIFVQQEKNHSKIHKHYNRAMTDNLGIKLEELELPFVRSFANVRQNYSPKKKLALTVVLEHLTSSFAHVSLNRFKEKEWVVESDLDKFWCWHAVEEIEHCHVAYDLYQSVYNDKVFLVETFKSVIEELIQLFKLALNIYLIRSRLKLKVFREWTKTSPMFYGHEGVLAEIKRHVDAFYSENYTPKNYFPSVDYYSDFLQPISLN